MLNKYLRILLGIIKKSRSFANLLKRRSPGLELGWTARAHVLGTCYKGMPNDINNLD